MARSQRGDGARDALRPDRFEAGPRDGRAAEWVVEPALKRLGAESMANRGFAQAARPHPFEWSRARVRGFALSRTESAPDTRATDSPADYLPKMPAIAVAIAENLPVLIERHNGIAKMRTSDVTMTSARNPAPSYSSGTSTARGAAV